VRHEPPLRRSRQSSASISPLPLVAPVYAWFTEGFDTQDLKEAKGLLDELT